MSLVQTLLNKVIDLTTKFNLLESNAKKTEELPALATIEGTGKIRVSVLVDGVWTSKYMTVQQLIDSSSYYIQNQIVSIGEITLDENELTIPFAQWIISGVSYSKITDTIINIPFADTGKTRIDIIVATTSNTLIRVAGVDTIGVAVRPNIPINTVLVTQINVSDSEILSYPNTLYIGEFTQAEWDDYTSLDSAFNTDGSYAFVSNSGVRKTYWYSQALGGWFTWATGGGGSQNLAQVLQIGNREMLIVNDDVYDIELANRYLYLFFNDTSGENGQINFTNAIADTFGDSDEILGFNGISSPYTLVINDIDDIIFPNSGVGFYEIPRNCEFSLRRIESGKWILTIRRYVTDSGSGGGAVASVNGATGTVVLDADDINDTSTTNKFSSASEKTKLSYITITQAVDLDALETRVNELDAAVVLKGTWDASAGTFPASGTAQAGWSYLVSVDGIVDGIEFKNGDGLIAVTDNASTTTYASNWYKADYTDRVNTVAGRTGNVVITSGDLSDFESAVNSLIAAGITGKQNTLTDSTFGALTTTFGTEDAIDDDDVFNYSDTSNTAKQKKTLWSNIKAVLKTYFDSLYVAKTSWIDYSAISTITGFSVISISEIFYKEIDSTLDFYSVYISGTSSSTTFQITIANNSLYDAGGVNAIATSNGNSVNASGRWLVAAGSNVVDFRASENGANFSASGVKAIRVQFYIRKS